MRRLLAALVSVAALASASASTASADRLVSPSFLSAATCVHGREGAWSSIGYVRGVATYGGGMQFALSTWNRAARLSHGRVPYASSLWAIAKVWPPLQVLAASIIVHADGGSWREWRGTASRCGLWTG